MRNSISCKADIDQYRQSSPGYASALCPAINVKCYDFGRGLSAETFGCDEEVFNTAIQYAFESAQSHFWEDIPETAQDIFGAVRVYAAGRSSGWLIVRGLYDVESWDAVDLAKWRKFSRQVTQEVEYLCSDIVVQEDIEANNWHKAGAEQYNFFDGPDGPVCIADLKAEAIAAGYGHIIRN